MKRTTTKHICWCGVAIFVGIAAASAVYWCSSNAPIGIEAKLIAVTDGDTVKLLIDSTQVRVRLAHIDAPERKQAFGAKATEHLSNLINQQGEIVRLVETDRDRYGRIIGDLYSCDGSCYFNIDMVRDGFAWHFKQYSDDSRFDAAEAAARANRSGLWSDTQTPIPPWDFR